MGAVETATANAQMRKTAVIDALAAICLQNPFMPFSRFSCGSHALALYRHHIFHLDLWPYPVYRHAPLTTMYWE